MSLELDSHRTALVIIDLQRGITAMPVAPYSASDVVKRATALAQVCAEVGALIIPVHVAFSADGGDRLHQPVDSPSPIPAGGPPPGWSDFVPEIDALRATFRITKRQWSAFYGTELDLQLRRRRISTVLLCGISTNFGVESTARDAWQHGYAVVVAEDACTGPLAEMHRVSVERIMPRIAQVRSTQTILAALRRNPA